MNAENLYKTALLDLAHHPQHTHKLDQPTHQSSGANLSCGDEIEWQAVLDSNGQVLALSHQTRGCVICKASAELAAAQALGQTLEAIQSLKDQEYLTQIQIPLSPMREKCALLALNSLQNLKPLE